MSDLGAIFHVKKGGVQYNAHAYTTLDECPFPNIKISLNGKQAYVKLYDKGDGDVPCYVKTKAGGTYQVAEEAIPVGSKTLVVPRASNFTVPKLVKVIKVSASRSQGDTYIGVTPNATYRLDFKRVWSDKWPMIHVQGEDEDGSPYGLTWQPGYKRYDTATISWSHEINKHAVTIQDYI